MKLQATQLAAALERKLAPIYLLSGDEPLQLGECSDQIRQAARTAGYINREVFFADNSFNWNELAYASDAMSLFSEPRLLEVKMDGAVNGKESGAVLKQYAESPPEETILMVVCGKLTSAVFKSAWFKKIDEVAVVIQVWPLEGHAFSQWLKQRASQRGLSLTAEGLQILASRVEGNLLAAAQELEKLLVLYGARALTTEQIEAYVGDSARYDVYSLVDAALMGKPRRAARILASIQREGIAAPIALWALARETRLLAALLADQQLGLAGDSLFKRHGVWDKRRPLLQKAMQRFSLKQLSGVQLLAARIDRVIKGVEDGLEWDLLEGLATTLAGVETPITRKGLSVVPVP